MFSQNLDVQHNRNGKDEVKKKCHEEGKENGEPSQTLYETNTSRYVLQLPFIRILLERALDFYLKTCVSMILL